jgi:hypothetical protein
MGFTADNGKTISDAQFDAMAEEYENGSWSGHGEISRGRPRLYDEDMETVTFRLPKSSLHSVEAVARSRGESKSEFIREAVDKALLAA